MLLTLGLDFLASIARPNAKNYYLRGWSVYSDELVSEEPFVWAISRQHRDRHSPLKETVVGRVYTRILASTAKVTALVIRDIHESHEHTLTAVACKYKVLQLGVYFPSAKKRFQNFAAECP